jgi:hypothetical protein
VAKGDGPCVKCYALLALVLVVILAATNVWNPFPKLWTWVNQTQPLSTPAPVWQQQLGSMAKSVTVAGSAVVVEHRTTVEALSIQAGVRLWQTDADWGAVAGAGDAAVVAVGELLVKGYSVLDADTGTVLRRDREAVAVWTYRTMLLDLRCLAAGDCVLSAWDPRGAQPLWTVPVPGTGLVLFADNPGLPGTRLLTAARANADVGGPVSVPALLGFRADGKVHVVDTAAGRVVQVVDPPRGDRLVVVGGRVVTVSARARDGTCYFTVTATDPAAGQQVWQQSGLNLRTTQGAGCEQRDDPVGGLNVLLGVVGEGREVLLDAYDGRSLWRGAREQRVLAVDDRYAVVRAPDGRSISGYPLGRSRVGWQRDTATDTQAALTPYAAVLLAADPPRVLALNPPDGRVLLEVRSSARVLAVGPAGLVVGEGRDIAYLRFAGKASPGDGTAGTPATGGPQPPCGGPKEPACQRPAGR